MADSTDLTDAITSNATSPNSATADGVTVTQNPPSEQIEAEKYLLANADALSPNAANTTGSRRVLRNRSRYETGSNSLYAAARKSCRRQRE